MKRPLQRVLAGLALATAAATGTLVATTDATAAPVGDTAWGAPATTNDTAWGTPPTDGGDATDPGSAGDVVSTLVTPFDTAWG